jgi:hypothetical protein
MFGITWSLKRVNVRQYGPTPLFFIFDFFFFFFFFCMFIFFFIIQKMYKLPPTGVHKTPLRCVLQIEPSSE